jgi:hypothetical protein
MNTNGLAKHYATLKPEERFRLIVAANERGDEAESQRLTRTAKRCTFSNMDYSPFAHALHDLAILTFLELLDEAARHDDVREQWADAEMSDSTGGKHRRNRSPRKERLFELFLVQGFILRTKAAGWNLFCNRIGIEPQRLWQYLPGFERLKRTLLGLQGTPDRPAPAYTPAGMVNWLNRVRPDHEPEVTEANILSPETIARQTDAAFHERARWWGADE